MDHVEDSPGNTHIKPSELDLHMILFDDIFKRKICKATNEIKAYSRSCNMDILFLLGTLKFFAVQNMDSNYLINIFILYGSRAAILLVLWETQTVNTQK